MEQLTSIEKIRLAENSIREQEKQIKFQIKPFRVADLVDKYEKKQFFIPDYQREDIWTYAMKSKFIESVLLGLPIPDLYVCQTREDDEDYDKITQYEVIDGSQRLRTLANFVKGEFYLSKLETVKELEDLYYNDLTEYRKEKFKDITIDVVILDQTTTEDVKNEMFDRINTSNPLQIMELRRGSYTGLFNDLIRDCGNELQKNFSDICPINKYFKDRREEEELTLRFFAFAETFDNKLSFNKSDTEEVSKFSKSTDDFLTEFYDYKNREFKALKETNEEALTLKLEQLKNSFFQMLEFVRKNFPQGFRRNKSKSVARPVFEAISVGVHLALLKKPSLSNSVIEISWLKNKKSEFNESMNQKYGLHKADKIIERITIVRDALLKN